MLYSTEYAKLNKKLHETNDSYGTSGKKYLIPITMLSDSFDTKDILDYGCGKRTLEKALGFEINNYDPAIEGFEKIPEPSDIVVCTDVLEHIEPECLDDLLDDLKRCVKKVGFFIVATRPAQKILEDGRNAHLIQNDFDWWLPKFESRFKIDFVDGTDKAFAIIVLPKEE